MFTVLFSSIFRYPRHFNSHANFANHSQFVAIMILILPATFSQCFSLLPLQKSIFTQISSKDFPTAQPTHGSTDESSSSNEWIYWFKKETSPNHTNTKTKAPCSTITHAISESDLHSAEESSTSNDWIYTAKTHKTHSDCENIDTKSEAESTTSTESTASTKSTTSKILRKHGFNEKEITADGNCLYRSLAEEIFGDQEFHILMRQNLIQYMQTHREHFTAFFIDWDFDAIMQQKSVLGEWGDQTDITAFTELYHHNVYVYEKKGQCIQVTQHRHPQAAKTIHLSRHSESHYNFLSHTKETYQTSEQITFELQ